MFTVCAIHPSAELYHRSQFRIGNGGSQPRLTIPSAPYWIWQWHSDRTYHSRDHAAGSMTQRPGSLRPELSHFEADSENRCHAESATGRNNANVVFQNHRTRESPRSGRCEF